MIFTAYIDESDTHGPSPDMVMSAILGSSRQWELFSRRLKTLQQDNGFSILHGTEFKTQSGEFSNWPEEKGRKLLYDLGFLVGNCLTEGVTVSLKYNIYKEHFLNVRPPKMHQTSQYGICFLATLDLLEKTVLNQGKNHRLSVVMEAGHKNASDTTRLFNERMKQYASMNITFLKSHALASKKECEPLMVADVMAYGSVLKARHDKVSASPPVMKEIKSPRLRETGWTVAEVGAPYFKAIIDGHLAERAEAHADYMKRKERWMSLSQNGVGF